MRTHGYNFFEIPILIAALGLITRITFVMVNARIRKIPSIAASDRHRQRRGATLVEVMFAIILLVILAVASVSALEYSRSLVVVTAAHKQAAIHAANDALEAVYSMGYNSASNRTLTGLGYDLHNHEVSGSQSVVESLDAGGRLYKHVTVSINYYNAQEPVVLETHITP